MLSVNQVLTLDDCKDGSANQLIVSETSAYLVDAQPPYQRHRIDGSGEKRGAWFMGTDSPARPPISSEEVVNPSDRLGVVYNVTTLRYPVVANYHRQPALIVGSGNSGIHSERGANNPLNSGHPHGAMGGYLDGHVELLTLQTSELILKRLATRDDGGETPNE